ncbi:MAG: NfeD family protein [Burkholderiaceae bacterium]|nr:NfeD family protein [Burkholderiaceae bacterium]
MQLQYWWWILALLLGVLEVVTGTFYLLVFAVGAAAGGVAAWAGAGLTTQVLVVAAVTVAGWLWLRRRSPWRESGPAPASDPNMLLDVGERLSVEEWGPDRRAQVRYRGAAWTVELDPLEPATAAVAGVFVIGAVIGSRLIVRRAD